MLYSPDDVRDTILADIVNGSPVTEAAGHGHGLPFGPIPFTLGSLEI